MFARVNGVDRLFFISSIEDLYRNLNGVCDALCISDQERQMLTIDLDRRISEGRATTDCLAPFASNVIGCSVWSYKKEPNQIGVHFCGRHCQRP